MAGGFGTRMLPLTERRPKHLLEVGGVPFLVHQITRLAAVGVRHVVLATSYHAELFRPVLGDGERYGVRLTYVTEDEPLGTGGAIRNVAGALDPDPDHAVVILNGDVLSDHDLRAQLEDFHRPREGRPVDVSLHLVQVEDPRAFGCVPTDAQGRVEAFLEKTEDPPTDQVNAGCYVFRRSVVDTIPEGRVVSVERETFPGLLADGHLVVGHVETAYWRDVGSPAALVAASRDLVLGHARSSLPEGGREALVVEASVEGAVDGGSSVLGGAVVARGARVSGSVLMPGARVGVGAVVVDSVLGPGASVGAGARLEEAAVGDEAVVPEGLALPSGTRVACGTTASA
ncbi:NDP-sugar synthase [Nocardioides marmoribigeumensis]|uniref:Mannose-1-phosphate guanylyltransferase n=1 Tax=Nocardioides marmoribigeumensis TaxID=433649 RepID=A0ABU2C049_9ACTN|nr:NDP-sugar synthase [Nocardioides marmoribigeumensis]MDR7364010.1 mannose-1-phosphate guanylyltransferase [Nocardioides marmoribigeumensis]